MMIFQSCYQNTESELELNLKRSMPKKPLLQNRNSSKKQGIKINKLFFHRTDRCLIFEL